MSFTAMEKPLFRKILPEDVTEALILFKRVFQREISSEYYQWNFFNNTLGLSFAKGAWIGDKLVSHIGFTPRYYIINGGEGLALQKPTTMTDPDFQGRGYNSGLLMDSLEEFRNNGIKIIVSLPNVNSHRIHVRHNTYEDIATLPALTWRNQVCADVNREIDPLRTFIGCDDYNFDCKDLCEQTMEGIDFCLKLSPEYLLWRFKKHPLNKYYVHEYRKGGELKCLAVFKLYPTNEHCRMNIVNLLYSNDDLDSLKSLISDLISYADENKLEVQTWQNVHHRSIHRCFENMGFTLDAPVFYFGIYPLAAKEELGSYSNYSKWMVSMGDVDVF